MQGARNAVWQPRLARVKMQACHGWHRCKAALTGLSLPWRGMLLISCSLATNHCGDIGGRWGSLSED